MEAYRGFVGYHEAVVLATLGIGLLGFSMKSDAGVA